MGEIPWWWTYERKEEASITSTRAFLKKQRPFYAREKCVTNARKNTEWVWLQRENLVRRLLGNELQVGAVLIEGVLRDGNLTPEIGGKEGVGFGDLRKARYLDRDEYLSRSRRTAAKVAFKKLPIVAVEPLAWV